MKKKFDLVLTVWGPVYTDMFLRICLPSLLAPGNLPAFGPDAECRFKIYTRSNDEKMMRQDRTFARLISLMPIDFIAIDKKVEKQNTGISMTTCQNAAISEAREKSVYLVFIIPDVAYSDGSFRLLLDLVEKGYKGILVFPLGVIRDSFIEAYRTQYYDQVERTAAITSRAMFALWRKHQHPMSNFFLWDSRHHSNESAVLGWKSEDGSFIVRSTQFTPLMLYPETDYLLPMDRTLDSVLSRNIIKDPSTVYIVRDSQEAMQVEMRPMTEGYIVPFDRPNVPMIACHLNWFRMHGNGNTDYLEQEVWFHSKDHVDNKEHFLNYSSSIYRTIKDMAEFSSLDQFTAKLKKYYGDRINGRQIVILGKGYIVDITSAFLRNMGFDCRFMQNVNDIKEDDFVFLAMDMSEMEMNFTHLEIRGLHYEQDFQITPLAYRHFRKMVPPPHSWKRYYYDYYLPAQKNGVRWTLQVLWHKLIRLKAGFMRSSLFTI